jgi:hypothetical protein
MKQHHTIEIFSANCPLCKHMTDDVEIGTWNGHITGGKKYQTTLPVHIQV